MTVKFIRENEQIPQGFYIKQGSFYSLDAYTDTITTTKWGNDGLAEDCIHLYGVYDVTKKLTGPLVNWVTFGYNFKSENLWFRIALRFRDVSRDKGKGMYFSFDLLRHPLQRRGKGLPESLRP